MDQIAFKNFRRFEEFPSMDLGGVNIFVGKNSSGKSSVIKAMILVIENIVHLQESDLKMGEMIFASETVGHFNIGNFQNNLRHGADPSSMEFSFSLGDVQIDIALKGEGFDNQFYGNTVPIQRMSFFHKGENFRYILERKDSSSYNVTFYSSWESIKLFYKKKLSEVQDRFIFFKQLANTQSDDILENYSIDFKIIDSKNRQSITNKKGSQKMNIKEQYNFFNKMLLEYDNLYSKVEKETGDCTISWAENIKSGFGSLPKRPKEDILHNYFIFSRESIFSTLKRHYPPYLGSFNYQYIEAHNASHNELLYTEDKNNYLTRTILMYDVTETKNNTSAKAFILKWMKEFEIAEDFEIQQPYGEAYRVLVRKDDYSCSLGSLGTGSIQIFILLLQLAIAIKTKKQRMIFIEEPEQNLHPAFQSKLADMFWEIFQESKGRIQLVIETHSEYLVRRTQVIAKKTVSGGRLIDAVNGDIKVYYFNENEPPTSMNFLPSGYFENKFGSGFYDTAGDSFLELLYD